MIRIPEHAVPLSTLRGGDYTLCDLHIHTVNSIDGKDTAEDCIKEASEKGLQFIAITDHDFIASQQDLIKWNRYGQSLENPVTIISAIEITLFLSWLPPQFPHVILLNAVAEEVDAFLGRIRLPLSYATGLPKPEQFFNWIETQRQQGTMDPLVVAAHPEPNPSRKLPTDTFKQHLAAWLTSFRFDWLEQHVEHFDVIEALNFKHRPSIDQQRLALARKLGLPVVGGSDAHRKHYIGKGGTFFTGNVATTDELLERIRKGEAGIFYDDESPISG